MSEKFRNELFDAGENPANVEVGPEVAKNAFEDPEVEFAPDEVPHVEGIEGTGIEDLKELAAVGAVLIVLYLGYRTMAKGLRDAKRHHGSVL